MESSVLNSNLSAWRSRGSEKGSFIQKPRGGLWLRQKRASRSSAFMVAQGEWSLTGKGWGHRKQSRLQTAA